MRKHHGTNVAPVHNNAAGFAHTALLVYHFRTHTAHGGYFGNNGRYFRRTDCVRNFRAVNKNAVGVCFGLKSNYHFLRQFFYKLGAERFARLQKLPRYGAVHGPGININVTKFACDQFGYGAFSGTSRAVDGNYRFLCIHFIPTCFYICAAKVPAA